MTNRATTIVEYVVNDAIRNLDRTADKLDDVEESGKRLEVALRAAASKAAAELDGLAGASQAMAAALGSDFVEAQAKAGRSIDDIVLGLHEMGASFDQIKANAGGLSDAVRELDTIRVRADGATTGLDAVTRSSDQSRSVLANMVGNSAQDLGQLGGVAGSVGVALGQLAEYAADGNISLANLAKFAGPMAALGLASFGISKAFEAAADRAEEAARKADVLRDVIEKLNSGDAKGAAEGLVTEYEKTLDILERFGYTAADLKSALEGSGYVVRGLADDMKVLQEMRDELLAKQTNGTLLPDEQAQLEWLLSELTAIEAVQSTITKDQEGWAAAAAGIEQFNARVAAVNENLRLQSGYWADIARAQARDNTGADALADQDKAATVAANKISALRNELQRYIAEVGKVPQEKVTEIEAALSSGNIALVERLLANLTRDRVARVSVVFGKPTQQIGKGSAVGTGAKGSRTSTDPQAVLKGLLDEADAATGGGGGGGGTGGGGGGGGGGAADKADDPMAGWDAAMAKAFAYQEITLDAYRKYLTERLGAYDRYSDEYFRIWQEIDKLNDEEAKKADQVAKEVEEAEKRKADAMEARARRQEDLDAIYRAARDAMAQGFDNLPARTIYISSNDPSAVVSQIKAYERDNGPSWRQG